jgi:hypothetical protein
MMTQLFEAFGVPTNRLGRELIVVLMIKLTIIGLAAVFVFGPGQRPRIDTAKVEAHLIGVSSPSSLRATAASNSAASQKATSKTGVSKTVIQKTALPNAAVPKTAVPKTAVPKTAVPKTAASRSEIP